jgi:hypothetical protein
MRTLRAVCARAGIDSERAKLVTGGEIAVYDLRGLWLVAKVARTIDYLPDFTTEVAVARWLESAAFPAARLAGPVDQSIVFAGRVLTFWAQVAEHKYYGTVTVSIPDRARHRWPRSPLRHPESGGPSQALAHRHEGSSSHGCRTISKMSAPDGAQYAGLVLASV